MTDNEIIKALECCSCWESYKSCEDCPENTYDCGCANKLEKHSLDLINRQKAIIEKSEKVEHFADKAIETANAEIERLNIELQSMRSAANSYKMHYVTAKSEAIKEFAERLKENIRNAIDTYYNSYGGGYYHAEDTIDDIDILVKEMTEVEE